MRNGNKKGFLFWIKYFALIIVVLVFWEYITITGKIPSYALPSIQKVLGTAWKLLADGILVKHILASFARVLTGFFIGFLLAMLIGFPIALSKNFEEITELIIQILKPIPPIAWIPLAILWFGIGEVSKIYIIFMGSFFPILINVVAGIKEIDGRLYELGTVYEIPKTKLIRKIVFPGALHSILTGVRVGLGNAWICVVASEMIAANSGVGYMLNNGRSLGQPDQVVLGMIIIGVVGKLMDDVLKKISVLAIKWE